VYVFDTNIFTALGHYFPSVFPTVWEKINRLVADGRIVSVKEVKRELDRLSRFPHIDEWVKANRGIFLAPSETESQVVMQIFLKEQYRGLVKRQNILRGLPVADPFIIAAAMVQKRTAVTQESRKKGGARIPTICDELKVKCINLEEFLKLEGIKY
jgi:hypothetical protein